MFSVFKSQYILFQVGESSSEYIRLLGRVTEEKSNQEIATWLQIPTYSPYHSTQDDVDVVCPALCFYSLIPSSLPKTVPSVRLSTKCSSRLTDGISSRESSENQFLNLLGLYFLGALRPPAWITSHAASASFQG